VILVLVLVDGDICFGADDWKALFIILNKIVLVVFIIIIEGTNQIMDDLDQHISQMNITSKRIPKSKPGDVRKKKIERDPSPDFSCDDYDDALVQRMRRDHTADILEHRAVQNILAERCKELSSWAESHRISNFKLSSHLNEVVSKHNEHLEELNKLHREHLQTIDAKIEKFDLTLDRLMERLRRG
jgi:hypothetical protein